MTRIGLIGLASSVGLLVACVESRPIVDTKREAGVVTVSTTDLPQDLPPSDSPGCLTCSAVLSGGIRPNVACAANKPRSSASLLGAYIDCACRAQCPEKCSAHCGGASPDPDCRSCLEERCQAALSDCQNEKKP